MIRLFNFVDHVNKNATKEHDRKFLKQLLEESGKTFDDLVALTNSQVSIFLIVQLLLLISLMVYI